MFIDIRLDHVSSTVGLSFCTFCIFTSILDALETYRHSLNKDLRPWHSVTDSDLRKPFVFNFYRIYLKAIKVLYFTDRLASKSGVKDNLFLLLTMLSVRMIIVFATKSTNVSLDSSSAATLTVRQTSTNPSPVRSVIQREWAKRRD